MSRLDRALAKHRAAANEFAARVERVGAAQWLVPRAPGKWSPAEEALHIRQAYDVLLDAMKGGAGLRPRVSEARAAVFRTVLLPVFALAGRLPTGIRAPREVKPDPTEASRVSPSECASGIRERAASFEVALADARTAGRVIALRHPYFGLLDCEQALRFVTVHNRHHMRHLPI